MVYVSPQALTRVSNRRAQEHIVPVLSTYDTALTGRMTVSIDAAYMGQSATTVPCGKQRPAIFEIGLQVGCSTTVGQLQAFADRGPVTSTYPSGQLELRMNESSRERDDGMPIC